MTAAKPTPGPWSFLEEGQTETEYNRCRPLTICGGPNNDDIANVFSRDDATVSISREEAVANARLMASAPAMLEQLSRSICYGCDRRFGDFSAEAVKDARGCINCRDQRAAIAKAVTP